MPRNRDAVRIRYELRDSEVDESNLSAVSVARKILVATDDYLAVRRTEAVEARRRVT
jgi:hypothetical protein